MRQQQGFSGVLLFAVIILAGLSPSLGQAAGKQITLSWPANHERGVNALGGGYRVYLGQRAGFALEQATLIDVPNVGGAKTPTSVTVAAPDSPACYIRVVAYTNSAQSQPSDEVIVTLR